MKFRKKPLVVEARHFRGDRESGQAIQAWAAGTTPQCLIVMETSPTFEIRTLIIPTPEGKMEASEGDWVIRGVRGEFYPCAADIFAATYEPVEAP